MSLPRPFELGRRQVPGVSKGHQALHGSAEMTVKFRPLRHKPHLATEFFELQEKGNQAERHHHRGLAGEIARHLMPHLKQRVTS